MPVFAERERKPRGRAERTDAKGVFRSPEGDFIGCCRVKGRVVSLGRFPSREMAALAVSFASRRLSADPSFSWLDFKARNGFWHDGES